MRSGFGRDRRVSVYCNPAVEVHRVVQASQLGGPPTRMTPRERELSGRSHGVLTAVVAAAEVVTVAGRCRRDQHHEMVVVDDQDLAIEIDLDALRFSIRPREWCRKLESHQQQSFCGSDATVARQSADLLEGLDRVSSRLIEHAVDRARIEPQLQQPLFEHPHGIGSCAFADARVGHLGQQRERGVGHGRYDRGRRSRNGGRRTSSRRRLGGGRRSRLGRGGHRLRSGGFVVLVGDDHGARGKSRADDRHDRRDGERSRDPSGTPTLSIAAAHTGGSGKQVGDGSNATDS